MTTNAVDKCLFAISEAEEVEVERELRCPAPFSPAWPSQASLVPRTTASPAQREVDTFATYRALLIEREAYAS